MQRLFGFLISWVLIFLVVIGAGELAVRSFTRVTFLGTTRGAFAGYRFGASYGNAPNYTGVSFGVPFTTDEHGFRIDPDVQDPIGAPGVLILGDSVAFGPGVPEPETMAGRLRRARPDRRIYNASAIGYNAADYAEAGTRLLTALQPQDIFVVYCLNDVASRTAEQIQEALANAQGDQLSRKPDGMISGVVERANLWLRSRSKLFLFAKNAFVDTSQKYFDFDRTFYEQGQPAIEAGLAPLVRLRDAASRSGVRFTVFVMPYEPQLRGGQPNLSPQRAVDAFLRGRQIPFEDALARFTKAGGRSKDLFIFGDPMHLSAAGHEIAARMLQEHLPR